MGANDAQKQSLLDQLTAAATTPQPVPPVLASATGAPALADAPATAAGSIANLEEESSHPARDSEALKAAEATDHPGFLTKLKNFAGGAFGLESPDENSSAEKGAKVAGLLGRTGNALATAAGTPEEKQIAEENAQIPLKLAQIQNEREYRRALIGTKNDTNDINQQKADQQKQAADGRMRLKGYVPDEQAPGAYRVMDEDEILADPVLSQNQSLQQAATASKNAGSLLALARRDALLNPDNPTLQLKAKQIDNTYKLAQAHLAMQLHAQGRQDFQDLQNFGGDVNGRVLTPQNAIPGTPVDGNGNPVAVHNRTQVLPTAQVRNIGAQAAAARAGIDKTIGELQNPTFAAKLGMVTGRWNAFTQGKIGVNDPDMAALQTDLVMTSTAVALAHARGRLPENLREEFDRMIHAPQQTPENIISTLEHIKPYMKNLEDRGTVKTISATASSSEPSPVKLSVQEWLKKKNSAGSK